MKLSKALFGGWATLCVCVVLLFTGCTENENGHPSDGKPNDGSAVQLDEQTAQKSESAQTPWRELTEGDLETATPEALDQWIKQQSQPLVLVDFWATWCPPCVAKFPKLVELAKDRSDGLQVLAISSDELSDTESVLKVLNRVQPPFPQWIVPKGAYEANVTFDLDSLPTCRLYNHQGDLLKEWNGEFEIADIEKEIESQSSSR